MVAAGNKAKCLLLVTTVTYEGLPSIKLHDSLITLSSDLDFSYMSCRFETQTPKSSPTSCFLNFKFLPYFQGVQNK